MASNACCMGSATPCSFRRIRESYLRHSGPVRDRSLQASPTKCLIILPSTMAHVGRWFLGALLIVLLGATSVVLLQSRHSYLTEVRQLAAAGPRQDRTTSRGDLLVVIPTSNDR